MIGNILTSIAFIAAVTSAVMYFLNYRGYQNTLNFGRIAFHTMATSTILASVFLLYLILTHQFQYKYVYSYSDTSLPLGLLISTFYAGQEGSFLLWALWMSVIGVTLQQYSSARADLEPRVMSVFSLVQSFLLLMITPLVKNPFALIYSEPFMASANTINSQFFNLPFLANYIFTDNSTGMNYIKIDQSLVETFEECWNWIKRIYHQWSWLKSVTSKFLDANPSTNLVYWFCSYERSIYFRLCRSYEKRLQRMD